MTVQILKLTNGDKRFNIVHDKDKFKLMVFGRFAIGIELDRNQAQLLKLWLEEHLK